MTLVPARAKSHRLVSFVDVILFVGIFCLLYALIGVAQQWAGPYRPKTEIDLGFFALVRYSVFSLTRVGVAYLLSLAFTLSYGYFAAKSRVGEIILIPLLDILQSVPVLGFMPGLVLALVNLFPSSNLGLELAAIIMIFTGQGWNMVFSFYSSLKNVPTELREMTALFRLHKLDVLRNVEIPFAMNGLLWNSMLSMAGGWFFVMTIESFSLGNRDFRLPGIGSYMAVAYEQGDLGAVLAGIIAMFTLIILMDRCVWAPLVVWSERFKFDRDINAKAPASLVLDWMKRSRLLELWLEMIEWLKRQWESRQETAIPKLKSLITRLGARRTFWRLLRLALAVSLAVSIIYGAWSMITLFASTTRDHWLGYLKDTFFSLLRVAAAVVIGSLWTIPLGVFIGTHSLWTRRLQPVVQIVASFPAPMLFPLIVFLMLKIGVGLEVGAVVLMLFASQWYILFNVISGATRIPQQMIELGSVFNVRGSAYWKAIILPAIFPSLVNGWITAAGGAWNASIVSEFVLYGNEELMATGIGASITKAAQSGDFPGLAAAILVMVTTVVLLNRLFWGALYRLAETRFRLE